MQSKLVRARIIDMTKNPMMIEFTGERIVERLTQKDLVKLDKIMKKHPSLNITSFLRIFRNILKPNAEEDFYITYGLFRLFQETCLASKHNEVTFNDISTLITDKMPSFNQDMRFSQKLYPLSFEIPDSIKKKIFAPEVIGKVLEERQRLDEKPYLIDKFVHLNRRVGQSFYSDKNRLFITIDNPTNQIMLLDSHFDLVRTVRSELEFSKRDSIIQHIAWSEEEQRLAALLGNYSISFWAIEDNFRFEVNTPLPYHLYVSPYEKIGYMESSRLWYTLDSRPSIHVLSPYNYEPEYTFTHFKMVNETRDIVTVIELKYRKLLCLAFEKNIFLISLEKRQLVTQLKSFNTSITSLAFSETYQALFVSCYSNKFHSFELTEHLDLTQKGLFEGHKNHVKLLGVLENRPVIFSIDEKSVMKLWDVRDFMCYQTFHVLKNVEYRKAIALPEAICLVGSKHFCYRWQRFTEFKQEQKVIYIGQFQKNILIVSNSQLRIYSHSSGVLLKVLKGVFGKLSIVRVHLIEPRKLLILMNEQGLTKIYSTKDFSPIMSFDLQPKPQYIYYDRQTELIAFACMREVRICTLKDMSDLSQKRRIFNDEEIIRFCSISAAHDLIALQFQGNSNLFFYSFQRAKLLGYLVFEDLIDLRFIHSRNILLILCKDSLFVFTYHKAQTSMAFFLKGVLSLWPEEDIKKHDISFNLKPYDKIVSCGMCLFDDTVVIVSNDACFHLHLGYNLSLLESSEVRINKELYNPYRIASENHQETFDPKKREVIIEQKQNFVTGREYFKHAGNRNFVKTERISLFYCVVDQYEVVFYNLQGQSRGVLNFRQTLPLFWELHNYSEEEFRELEFVLHFIQMEKNHEETFELTNPAQKEKGEIITMGMLKSKELETKGYRSCSLREKKMVLEKERDERVKEENYQEVRKNEEMAKLKNLNSNSNEKYISQSLAFLNVNRNKMLLTKGLPDIQLPQIRALEFKLNAAVNKDEKKSIVSKYSGGQDFLSPARKVYEEISKSITRSTAQLKLLKDKEQKESYKDQLKRLNLSLKQSKFKRSSRSSSLPALKYD